ncbi:DUF3179 domain-containing (seleno)protein [Deminuibacter soli]|uniref:DUF3179 domain-containing protein n=1 Tax=Deminuibacter soli TaxID=2291815 RepID=A0A3E1NHV0_9BACT|nr:DUF3179 domain-containing (seleno)protein [Deminuibacter soli]RFM27472.1 DUF3179 domain-containing protein [Deminuibacter soli]
MKVFLLFASLILLLAFEILRVYFIMPFPGSQQHQTIGFAYWLGRNIFWVRGVLLAVAAYALLTISYGVAMWKKLVLGVIVAFYAVVFYFFNFRFEADKMFYQPTHAFFAPAAANTIAPEKLVIGVSINGEAKAYPIQLIGYHHQVRDTVGHTPVMITYCTVCRTGRVYSPVVNGKAEDFRLVGMDHFNAMFEDHTTKSWWQQATGVAVAGPLKGVSLQELPAQQLTLSAWLREHPNSTILQPDTVFNAKYKQLKDYDLGTIDGHLEKRDSGSWKMKSWVVGVIQGTTAKAYDWNTLVQQQIIQDSLPGLPVLLLLEKDGSSFHVYNRRVNGQSLQFTAPDNTGMFTDVNTHSTWNSNGVCTAGTLQGQQLQPVQSYQEFWHSWQNFHPATMRYPG